MSSFVLITANQVKSFICGFDHLTSDEKYDLLHLLIKKIVYFEEDGADKDGKKKGKIKMDLWELPPINPSKLDSASNFAESNVWLARKDAVGQWEEHIFLP
jgi:site-specific DNA recombinase